MFSRFVTGLYMLAGVALAAMPIGTAAESIDLLSSTNATWSTSVGKSTCTIGARSSGDSVVATWTVDSGGWSDTWVSILCSPLVSLAGADSIKVLYENNNVSGYSLRLTLSDATMWESTAYLNGLVGLQAVNFPINATTFPQFKFAATDPNGTFDVSKISTISFINNTNPTVLTASTPVSGVYKIIGLHVITSGASVRQSPVSKALASNQIASTGITLATPGIYTVALYSASGALQHRMTSQFAAGFNRIDFSRFGSGVCIAKITGKGYASSARLIIGK